MVQPALQKSLADRVPLNRNGEAIHFEVGEFWTALQRQASSLHEISYRACFKPQLPRFFIERFSNPGDLIYDPFMGRGTTVIEAALLGRMVVGNDANPLGTILTKPRLSIPEIQQVQERLESISLAAAPSFSPKLAMFYHPKTEAEITALRDYLGNRKREGREDAIDEWIRMVATNRLTGHSKGFFSVYTLPPNQAASARRQIKINEKLRQKPEYRSVKDLTLRKTKSLLRSVTEEQRTILAFAGERALFLCNQAWDTPEIKSNSVQLTVTSPPFLDIVNYVEDNWLRCWFNDIEPRHVAQRITMSRSLEQWSESMSAVFRELYRVTQPRGFVAFEVGEIRRKSIRLEDIVIPIGENAGFTCQAVFINTQRFTKTANIWGIKNNESGTNSNRIVLFQKEHR
ncbi:MAG TPA: DNA methyltransferase [Bacteroidota bacterium]|nr:DNA methyltransferase [Bacteroidota bacterium]